MTIKTDDAARDRITALLDEVAPFKVGDKVMPLGTAETIRAQNMGRRYLPSSPWLGGDPRPALDDLNRMVVLTRIVVECHGGVQFEYDVRDLSGGPSRRYQGHELEPAAGAYGAIAEAIQEYDKQMAEEKRR